MTYSNVCIQTEGGGAKGLGHVYRSVTLAGQLPGARVSVQGEAAQAVVHESGVELYRDPLPPPVVIRDVAIGSLPTHDGASLVVDIVDEAHEASGQADIVFAALGESGPGVYAGLRYSILRQEFTECVAPPWERDTVVVCLGGVDPSRATMRIASSLHSVTGVRVRTINGPGSRHPPGDQPPVWEALYRAPMAIVSPGATLLECAALGVPALVVSHNERERARIARMPKGSWFRYLGSAADCDLGELQAETRKLLDSPNMLESMGRAGRLAVDGCGAWRVGAILKRRIAWAGMPAGPSRSSASPAVAPAEPNVKTT